MDTHILPAGLQAQLRILDAERRRRRAIPGPTLTAVGQTEAEFDANDGSASMPVWVRAADGLPIPGVLIAYDIIDDEGTGSAFLFEGHFYDRSTGVTTLEGYAFPWDQLITGVTPGTFIVRATAPSIADPESVYADFRFTVSSRIPTTIEFINGGDVVLPIGVLVGPDVRIRVLDQEGKPIVFGLVGGELYDPNGTGTKLYAGQIEISYWRQSLEPRNPSGSELFFDLLPGGNAPGKDFYLRVFRSRASSAVVDIPFTAGAPRSRRRGDVASPPAPAR